jgi:DNA modification methylase
VFHELRRVLRDDGTVWLNLGDSYASGKGTCFNPGGNEKSLNKHAKDAKVLPLDRGNKTTLAQSGLKPKDLIGIPFRVAFALQADGWYWRSCIPWIKRNPLPDSTKDRPAAAVEYVLLFTKSPRYFYDTDATRVEASEASIKRIQQKSFWEQEGGEKDYQKTVRSDRSQRKTIENFAKNPGRNARNSDWYFKSWQGLYEECGEPLGFIVNPKGYKQAHFAVFPRKLVEPCIKAGTSEKGCCPVCGAPWMRLPRQYPELTPVTPIVRKDIQLTPEDSALVLHCESGYGEYRISIPGDKHHEEWSNQPITGGSKTHFERKGYYLFTWNVTSKDAQQTEWQPTCTCDRPDPVPCTVLDPFAGSGTTGEVAQDLNRNSILIELNPEYVKIIEQRLRKSEQLVI